MEQRKLKFKKAGLLLAASALGFLMGMTSARAEIYAGALAGLGKDSAADSTETVYGFDAGFRTLDVIRIGGYYYSTTLKKNAAGVGTYRRHMSLMGLDLGAYLPVVLSGLYAGFKFGLSDRENEAVNGVAYHGGTKWVTGVSAGYDYKILPVLSVGFEANIMGGDGVFYSGLAAAKLWL
jgi:hypothetical protein